MCLTAIDAGGAGALKCMHSSCASLFSGIIPLHANSVPLLVPATCTHPTVEGNEEKSPPSRVAATTDFGAGLGFSTDKTPTRLAERSHCSYDRRKYSPQRMSELLRLHRLAMSFPAKIPSRHANLALPPLRMTLGLVNSLILASTADESSLISWSCRLRPGRNEFVLCKAQSAEKSTGEKTLTIQAGHETSQLSRGEIDTERGRSQLLRMTRPEHAHGIMLQTCDASVHDHQFKQFVCMSRDTCVPVAAF
ncbi:hypothetical protein BDP55DRAFT_755183 [Colletotrichum godetiae]|uniref:Uncharacterized protein n=1 Tax=Colletotrichum godetiae TaxID=1209918 RepID=A0AAJ0ADS0_9PEZI|nr:uncharacterized protein BDP55DRAFT_755183 [Colletotrichum godetiae]KAK1659842.1 hypothetical protein BDP55DRAFT_755183 [Colletotrichum godetiae]